MSYPLGHTPARTTGETANSYLQRVASRQRGLVTTPQLRAAQLERSTVSQRVARATLFPAAPHVYALMPPPFSHAVRRTAALLSCGPGSALARSNAAWIDGYWPTEPAIVEIVTPRPHRPIAGARITSSSTIADRDIVRAVEGNRTSPARTQFDLGGPLDAWELARVLDRARYAAKLSVPALVDVMGRNFGRRELATVAEALVLHEQGSAGSRSKVERRAIGHLVEARLPLPRLNTKLDCFGIVLEPDLSWQERRLIIEIDGPPHQWISAWLDDAAFDQLATAAGYAVLRVAHTSVDRDGGRAFVRFVRRALAAQPAR